MTSTQVPSAPGVRIAGYNHVPQSLITLIEWGCEIATESGSND